MSRFFITRNCIKADIALLSASQAHHILDVLRLKPNDHVQLFDAQGNLYRGRITDIKHGKVAVKIKPLKQTEPSCALEIILVQALPKANKMDYIVEKASELGVGSIVPTITARTVVRLDKRREALRRQRWRRIAQAASEQCGRTTIAQIQQLNPWPAVLSSLNNCDLKLLACLVKPSKKIKDILRTKNKIKKIAILIGPEGDFTPAEINQARQQGCLNVSLGANVLKTDTAALAALAMINYELR